MKTTTKPRAVVMIEIDGVAGFLPKARIPPPVAGGSRRQHPSLSAIVVWALLVLFVLSSIRASAVVRDGGIDPSSLGKGDWIYYLSTATNHLGGNVLSVTNENSSSWIGTNGQAGSNRAAA
jgi:hypothetical protein